MPRTEYDTKKEAQQALKDNATLFETKHFCPLTRDLCRTDCVCFFSPKVSQTTNRKWVIRSGACNNYMFFGEA